jgi:hypothetical protein
MTLSTRPLRLLFATGALACALAVIGQESAAQQPIPGAEGERALDAKELKGDERTTFNKLRDGNIDVKPDHQSVLAKAAQWYVFRVTWPQYQRKSLPESSDRMTMNDIVNDCTRQIPERSKMLPKGDGRNRQFKYIAEYGEEVTKACDEVLKNPMPIARVNAARILAHLGKTGPEKAADPLLRILKDKEQIEPVKLYALRGLKDLQTSVRETSGKFEDPAREGKIANGLIGFLHREPDSFKDTSPEAQKWLRREAVRALANGRSAIVFVKKEPVAQPALELLKVVSKDGLDPEPTIGERTDAAIGVVQMQGPKDYQPDYTCLHIGHYLLDFTIEYNNDRAKNGANMRAEPWKVEAAKLRLALEGLADDYKNNKNVAAFTARAKPVLEAIEKDQVPNTVLLKRFMKDYKPATSLYKSDDKSTVKLPNPDA